MMSGILLTSELKLDLDYDHENPHNRVIRRPLTWQLSEDDVGMACASGNVVVNGEICPLGILPCSHGVEQDGYRFSRITKFLLIKIILVELLASQSGYDVQSLCALFGWKNLSGQMLSGLFRLYRSLKFSIQTNFYATAGLPDRWHVVEIGGRSGRREWGVVSGDPDPITTFVDLTCKSLSNDLPLSATQ